MKKQLMWLISCVLFAQPLLATGTNETNVYASEQQHIEAQQTKLFEQMYLDALKKDAFKPACMLLREEVDAKRCNPKAITKKVLWGLLGTVPSLAGVITALFLLEDDSPQQCCTFLACLSLLLIPFITYNVAKTKIENNINFNALKNMFQHWELMEKVIHPSILKPLKKVYTVWQEKQGVSEKSATKFLQQTVRSDLLTEIRNGLNELSPAQTKQISNLERRLAAIPKWAFKKHERFFAPLVCNTLPLILYAIAVYVLIENNVG